MKFTVSDRMLQESPPLFPLDQIRYFEQKVEQLQRISPFKTSKDDPGIFNNVRKALLYVMHKDHVLGRITKQDLLGADPYDILFGLLVRFERWYRYTHMDYQRRDFRISFRLPCYHFLNMERGVSPDTKLQCYECDDVFSVKEFQFKHDHAGDIFSDKKDKPYFDEMRKEWPEEYLI